MKAVILCSKMTVTRLLVARLFSMLALSFAFFALTGNLALAAYGKTSAAAVEEASSPVGDATVNINCRLKGNNKTVTTNGSGVFISDRGIILTNAHVAQYFLLAKDTGSVKGRCSVRAGSPAKDAYTAEVLAISPTWLLENISKISERTPRGTGENDFALLFVTGAKKGKLPERFPALSVGSTETVLKGSLVTVAGYPVEKLSSSEMRNKLRLVVASSTVSNISSFGTNTPDVLTIAHSSASQGGVSGGPVADESDALVGIVATKSSSNAPTLHALSLSYIERAVQEEVRTSLASLLTGDFAANASSSRALIPETVLIDLKNGLRKKK